MTLSDSARPQPAIKVHDLEPPAESFRDEVIEGLQQSPKRLPSKLFYDERGSQLFERICSLNEYYLTRTELAIMEDQAPVMAEKLGAGVALVELGSGASVKTRILLDHLHSPAAYVPVDISRDHLANSAAAINADYPELRVAPVCADFTSPFALPPDGAARRVVYFPGSTIGNFEPPAAVALLRNIREICGADGGLLLGVDRKKDVATIEAAYNDAQGVTAAFNRNILARINREWGADFDVAQFEHQAHFNERHGRVEMHLLSTRDQTVRLNGHRFTFAAGESICTEFSYKFSLDDVAHLAKESGFRIDANWSDEAKMFSVLYLAALPHA